ncbi:hypothetical protein U14_00716 [Candidatus Moduliflexus flocculans]|uniref:DUF5615 domain-containing protein n=1 Tax=Candidatus Moduliflexus flocculans TaxID=1499966 RepID=A0A0S6VWF7_9BACT|nr:hypothetical protein U14_00716 [Candidatus Moduliflexus flocculans]
MNILADECVYQLSVNLLRRWGYSITTAQEVGLAGCPNGEVLRYAQQNQSVFLTQDKDFTDIRIYHPSNYYGIVVLKITLSNQEDVHHVLRECLQTLPIEQLHGTLVIIDRKKYRVIGLLEDSE